MKPFTAFRSKGEELFKFIKGIFSKKTFRRIVDELSDPNQSDGLKAFSAGLGIFMGIIPIWGLQTVAAIFAAMTFRLNRVLIVIFSQVSLPPIFPLIVFISYRIGRYWTGSSVGRVNSHIEQYLFGSITLAIAAGLVTGLVTYGALKIIRLVKQYSLLTRLKQSLQIR